MRLKLNGQEYDDWSQVPPELQRRLAAVLPDADRNGIPDLFEGRTEGVLDEGETSGRKTFTTATSIEVGGKHYDSLDMVPQGVRDMLGRAVLAHYADKLPSADQPTAQAVGQPIAATSGQQAEQPAAGQVQLNGETVAVDQATGANERKGLFSRIFGR